MGSAASTLVDTGISGSDNPTKPCVEGSQSIFSRVLADLVSLLTNVDWKRFASEMVHQLDLPAQSQAVVRWFWDQDQIVPAEAGSATGIGKKVTTTRGPDSLPNDIQADALQKVDFLELFSLKAVSSGWEKFVESDVFRQSRGGVSDVEFSAINHHIKSKSWRCSGYDLHSRSWWSFSTVWSYLPNPDAEIFKEYSVCDHGGLMCAEVSKPPPKGELVVFNPFTGESQALPPLLHPRNPVLVHILVDSAKRSFKVIVAGSSAASDEHLSRKVEVFDSSTSKWKEVSDLPGPAFGLNEHQAGVCLNGKLFFISSLEDGGRGVVAFDLDEEKWLQSLATPIPWSSSSNTLQLVVSDGKLFLFSEQESDQSVDHCIDELEIQNPKAGTSTCRWRSFVKVKKSGGRGLQVYTEYTCAVFEKPGIFNPLSWINHHPKVSILLACLAFLPDVAWAEDQSMAPLSSMWNPSNAWESPDFAKKAAVTLLVVIGAIVAWGIFRRSQVRDNRFDINRGLEIGDMPNRGNPLHAIPAEIFPA